MNSNHFELRFFVTGRPRSGGSKRAVVNQYTGQAHVIDASDRVKEWKALVSLRAAEVYHGKPLECPLDVLMIFTFRRPRGHFGTGRNASQLKASARPFPTGPPDVLKLARSTEDALTGIVWRDDALTVLLALAKVYGPRPGVEIRIRKAESCPLK